MKTRTTPPTSALFIAAVIFASSLFAADDRGAPILAVLKQQEDAWNAGDGEKYSAAFAEDGTFTNIRGTVFQGRAAFLERHVEIFRGFFKGSRLRSHVRRLHFAAENVALVDVDHEVSGLQGMPPGVPASEDGILRTRLLQVFVLRNGRWELVAYHNVDVKPGVLAPAGTKKQ
jgi:uncharacterized protein (TIGR02246 family)